MIKKQSQGRACFVAYYFLVCKGGGSHFHSSWLEGKDIKNCIDRKIHVSLEAVIPSDQFLTNILHRFFLSEII